MILPIISSAARLAIQHDMDQPVSDLQFLGMSTRTLQKLNENGIIEMRDLMRWTPERFLTIKSFGEKSLGQLFEALSNYDKLEQIKREQISPQMRRRIESLQ